MRNALHEQLLKAGLVDEKRLKEMEREQQRPKPAGPKNSRHSSQKHAQRKPPREAAQSSAPKRPAPATQPTVKPTNEQQAARRALEREIVQLIKAGRLPHNDGDEVYNFIDGKKIGRIYVTAPTQAALVRGELVVVRLRTRYAVVSAATAALIAERAPEFVIAAKPPEPEKQDPAYLEFPVPDDLRW
jgi:uncharacterized protein